MHCLVETGIIPTEKGHSDQPAIECGGCSGYTARSTLKCLKRTYPKSSDKSWIEEKMSLWIQNKSRDTRKDGLACYESALCNCTENGVIHRKRRYCKQIASGNLLSTSSQHIMANLHGKGRLLVQIGSYNTNLQGGHGVPQDLVDWLSPTLQVSTFLSPAPRAPDIVAVGFQELLPLHLGREFSVPFSLCLSLWVLGIIRKVSGLSKRVIDDRDALIKSQIEEHSPNNEPYSLIAKVVNVGVALLVYCRDQGVARTVCDVQTQWTGSGPGYMGNKGAVGARFRIPADDGGVGEVFTYVYSCSLEAVI